MPLRKTADKLHDFLMNPKSRPDLQTPGAQRFLKQLERLHTEKTDQLMPWLTREWKKGRLLDETGLDHQLKVHPVGKALPDEVKWALQAHDRGKPYEQVPGVGEIAALYNSIGGHPHQRMVLRDSEDPGGYLTANMLDHWGDYLNSNHPSRRQLGDLMQHNLRSFRERVHEWDEAMKAEAQQRALEGGEVVHTTPDGWTIRKLTTPEELKGEGDVMGHCVGGYADQVRNGHSLIYSLRDPKGHPHVTTEIQPTQYERQDSLGTHRTDARHYVNNEQVTYPIPHGGNVIQIQGKGNEDPIPEYKARMKDWFDTFAPEDKPQWAGPQWNDYEDYLTQPGEIEPRHLQPYDEYGLPGALQPDYDQLLENTTEAGPSWSQGSYEPAWGQNIYDLARAHGQIPQLSQALEAYQQKQQENFDEWREQNYEHTVPYPAEADEDSPEMQAYYEDEREWMQEHPGMMAVQDMYSKLTPHWNPQTNTYENEPFQYTPRAPGQVTTSAWPDL